jgi:hypothetical protein
VKWIEDFVDVETTGARKRVEDAETAIMQEEADMSNAEEERSTIRKPEITFEKMWNAIGDSLRDLVSSDDEEDGKHKEDEEDTALGMPREDDEPGWVMGTISRRVQYRMESFQQKQMRLDELMQLEQGDAAGTGGRS